MEIRESEKYDYKKWLNKFVLNIKEFEKCQLNNCRGF